jgi:hypothetical protein
MVVLRVPPGIWDGTYPGVITAIEVRESNKGDFLVWEVDALTENGPVPVSGTSENKLDRPTRTRRWAEAVLGRELEEGEDVHFDRLIGQPVLVVVARNDKGWAKIADILPPADPTAS